MNPEQSDALEGWTKEEKFYLLQALKASDSRDISFIQMKIPTKTLEQIESAIAYYRAKALKHPIETHYKKREKINKNTSIPLAGWAKYLTDTVPFEELQTETATAVRMISKHQNIPTPVCTDNIDFRRIYCLIADAMEGKPLPKNDKLSIMVLDKCLMETALRAKSFIRSSALKFIVENVNNMSESDIKAFLQHPNSDKLDILHQLALEKNYNPLHVPADFLRLSK